MADGNLTLSGVWRLQYWYPSNQRPGTQDISDYIGTITQTGNKLVFESHPNEINAYMFVKMIIDGDLVTGDWHENTSPTGEFKGVIYSGAIQLLVNYEDEIIDGKWVGIGQDNGKRQIYTGRWLFDRV